MTNTTGLITLSEYLKAQAENSYFQGVRERLYLAGEVLFSYHDEQFRKDKIPPCTPFINCDNLRISAIEQAEYSCEYYSVHYPQQDYSNKKFRQEAFTNFAYCPENLYTTKFLWGSKDNQNHNAIKNVTEADAVIIFSRILFEIVFCCHPYYGKDYYREVNPTTEKEKEFFRGKPKFIFNLENNPNRFVNGYDCHELAWALWSCLSEEQRTFWEEALDGKYKEFPLFVKAWKKNFEFTYSQCKAPCGVSLPALVFDDKHTLIVSDFRIGAKEMRCRRCNRAILSQCDACKVKPEDRVAKLFSVEATVVNKADGQSPAPQQKKLLLYDGKTIESGDISDTMASGMLFTVISSKKSNLLGMKYLQEKPIVALQDIAKKEYGKGDVIPLLPGVKIDLFDKYEIVIPGVSPKVAPAVNAAPAASAEPVSDAAPAVNAAPAEPAVIAEAAATSEPAEPDEVPAESAAKQEVTSEETQKDTPENNKD